MDKPIDWRGSSLNDLREFPARARQDAGYQLRKLQRGELPDDWRPLREIGPGSCEVRIECEDGWFRVMYVAKFEEAIYVLHSFRKTTRQTSKGDITIAKARYKAIVKERQSANDD